MLFKITVGAQLEVSKGADWLRGLPTHILKADEDKQPLECPTEIVITDRCEMELSRLGFIPLVWCKNTANAAFFTTPSTQKVNNIADAWLSSQLEYVITASRFAHYIKVMMRDSVSLMTPGDCERFLNRWISQYVGASNKAPDSVIAHFPLREARIEVSEAKGKPGVYEAVMYLRPRFQLDGLSKPLRLVVELPPPARTLY